MDPKPYDLTFDERPAYLYAGIRAAMIDRRIALEYFSEIADKCASVRCKRLLLDRDIPAVMSDGELLQTLEDYVDMSGGLKIAIVNRHRSIDKEWRAVIDRLEHRRADLGYFNDHETAETWLLQSHKP